MGRVVGNHILAEGYYTSNPSLSSSASRVWELQSAVVISLLHWSQITLPSLCSVPDTMCRQAACCSPVMRSCSLRTQDLIWSSVTLLVTILTF
mgnify:CR=1 FL=1